jgi:hypothetical protein
MIHDGLMGIINGSIFPPYCNPMNYFLHQEENSKLYKFYIEKKIVNSKF